MIFFMYRLGRGASWLRHIPTRRRIRKEAEYQKWLASQCNCSVHDIHPDDRGVAHARDCPRYD